MGLDMYLSASRYCSGGYDHSTLEEKKLYKKILRAVGVSTTVADRSVEVKVGIGYWRKANAIHQWFVEEVQEGRDECQSSYVSREKLTELKTKCQAVLDGSLVEEGMVDHGTSWSLAEGEKKILKPGPVIINPTLAQETLPTTGGFFFGSTSYDQWYLQDLKGTIKIIDNALSLPDCWCFYYQASW